MSSLSSIEVDSSPSDAFVTASTSRQPSTEVDSSSPDAAVTPSVPKQPAVHAPLSSIEHDPNTTPPETPSPQNEPVVRETGEKSLTKLEKLNIQLPLWQQHLYTFRKETLLATICSIIAFASYIAAYSTGMKAIFLGLAFGCCAAGFTCVWVMISEGPPFQCDKEGNAIQPDYLTPAYIDDDPSSDSLAQFGIQ